MGLSQDEIATVRHPYSARRYDYQSSPLSRNGQSFRLIQLRKEANDTVRYDLIPLYPTNAPDYEAVSNQWVSPELSCSIAIGDTFLLFTQSAFAILSNARLQPEDAASFQRTRQDTPRHGRVEAEMYFLFRYLQNLQSETSRLPLYEQDKVDAFLSLSCHAIRPHLQPNHKHSVGQIYQRTTIYSLGQGSLALPSLTGLANRKPHGSMIPDSPSWVAGFSRPGITCQIDNHNHTVVPEAP